MYKKASFNYIAWLNMMRSALVLGFLAGSTLATVVEWGQCGGVGYTGDTVCAAGLSCTVVNDWSTTTTISSTSKTITTVSTTTTSAPSATGFVKASGTRFVLNAAPYTVVGSNAYWPALLGYSSTDIDKAFSDIAATGATTVRLSYAFAGRCNIYITLTVRRLSYFLVASATCSTATITTGASNISAFIKSIDSNHLVAIGDEGFFNQPGSPDFVYQGTLGIDFAANMKISTLDFGTFHMYPDNWGESANDVVWGSQWINDHAAVMTAQKKPVIMEEFGVTTSSTRNATYATWYNTVISSGLTGDLIWQAGSILTNGPTPDDGYIIFPTDPVYALEKTHAAVLKARG
ncbi:glycoside hydrolase superfamily [Mycena sp. CBHHK59/15]|nr:glycoside hydrolase superfamily [Mycena sp. CBHHK59/15]